MIIMMMNIKLVTFIFLISYIFSQNNSTNANSTNTNTTCVPNNSTNTTCSNITISPPGTYDNINLYPFQSLDYESFDGPYISNQTISSTNSEYEDPEYLKINLPFQGSLFEYIPQFNISLKDYNIEMVIIVQAAGGGKPDSWLGGTFNKSIPVDNDLFGQDWKLGAYNMEKGIEVAAGASASNLNKTYIQNNKYLFMNSTKEISFITTTHANYISYATYLILNIYYQWNEQESLGKIRIREPLVWSRFNNSDYNIEGIYPTVITLENDYNNIKFGFEWQYTCSKANSWLSFAETESTLLKYYQTKYKKAIDFFANYFNSTTTFLKRNQPFLNLTDYNIRHNLTVGYFILDSLIDDFVLNNYQDFGNFTKFQQSGMFVLLSMKKFLLYEYFLYSNVDTNMVIAPFFEFMFTTFNNKLQILKGVKTNTTDFEDKNKIVWFITYPSNIATFYKMMHDNPFRSGFTSQIKTWNETIYKNQYINFALGLFSESIHFELISSNNPNGVKAYYIGFRENFKPGYSFVLPIRVFNSLASLFIFNAPFSEQERIRNCNFKK